jgi:hypothetical protein
VEVFRRDRLVSIKIGEFKLHFACAPQGKVRAARSVEHGNPNDWVVFGDGVISNDWGR